MEFTTALDIDNTGLQDFNDVNKRIPSQRRQPQVPDYHSPVPVAAANNSFAQKRAPVTESANDCLRDTNSMESPQDLSPPSTPIPRLNQRDPAISQPSLPRLANKRSATLPSVPAATPVVTQNATDASLQKEETALVQGVSSSELDDDSIDVEGLTAKLKRYSTIQFKDEEREASFAAPNGNPIRRHNTTGHTIHDRQQQSRHVGLSEDFDKELQARRRAFRRLSRLDDDKVLVGVRVDKNHSNYVLMYNMLTGIRIAVSRVSAKPERPLGPEDFRAAHKLVFNVTGDELTPGSKYDFKFKDYAPWVFHQLRKEFGIDPADYLVSLTAKYILSELESAGKSGSFFYYSRDYRFIIKTIHHSEHKYLRKILSQYYDHVKNNRDTLLCRYYGLHRVKPSHGKKKHFVVMGNVFPPNKDIHETYDLKGSLVGRFLSDAEKEKPNPVMKDRDFQRNNKAIQLGPKKRAKFIKQLTLDVKLLVKLNVMDYSLLIGIHNMVRGNKDNIRDSTLHLFEPLTKRAERRATLLNRRQSRVQVVRKAIAETNPEKLDSSKLPENPHNDRQQCVFYSDEGGFQATDENDEPRPALYYMGVIDILTPYDAKKKSEHFIKSLTNDKHEISAVNPLEYGNRFMKFMANTLEHHNDIPREFQTGPKFG